MLLADFICVSLMDYVTRAKLRYYLIQAFADDLQSLPLPDHQDSDHRMERWRESYDHPPVKSFSEKDLTLRGPV